MCLGDGTNAWTDVDHTAYEASTAGWEGMIVMAPLLLEHTLCPTLRDSHFVTEVYHLCGDGSEKGVVYAEMQGRENTEADLTDKAVRCQMFPGTSYSAETGGITTDIATLTMDEVRMFHQKFYKPWSMFILVVGLPIHAHESLLGALSHTIESCQGHCNWVQHDEDVCVWGDEDCILGIPGM